MTDLRLYERDGVWAAALSPAQRNLARAVCDFWPAGTSTALDVGGGDGKLSGLVAEVTGARVFSLDASRAALRRTSGALAYASRLPIRDGAVDVALSTDVLEHLSDADEPTAWDELFRVARTAVVVAVPFDEHLADGLARCGECAADYHVNWHQRSYRPEAFLRRLPLGWGLRALVLTGAPWSSRPPLETDVRRRLLGERSAWVEAVCPACGHAATAAAPAPGPLPASVAMAIGERLSARVTTCRASRSHSELLVVLTRGAAELPAPPGARIERARPDVVRVDPAAAASALVEFPPVGRLVRRADGLLEAQLPLRARASALIVERARGGADATVWLDDGLGRVLVAHPPVGRSRHPFARALRSGPYGVVARFGAASGVTSIALEQERASDVTWVEPVAPVGYHRAGDDPPVWIQATERAWLGDDVLAPCTPAPPIDDWREVVVRALEVEQELRDELQVEHDRLAARLTSLERRLTRVVGRLGYGLARWLTR